MNIPALLVAAATTFGFASVSERTRDLEHHAIVTPVQRLEIRGLSGSHIEFRSWDKNEVSYAFEPGFHRPTRSTRRSTSILWRSRKPEQLPP